MKTIAFKRAKHFPQMAGVLHPEFITESANTALFPVGYHKIKDGYEILSEAQFQEEIAKNDERQAEFVKQQQELEQSRIKVQEILDRAKDVEDKKLQKEFEEFRRWKQAKGKL